MSTRKADRKNRKGTRKQSGGKRGTEWTRLVTATYREMKARNPNAKLGDAMKEAARRRKAQKK